VWSTRANFIRVDEPFEARAEPPATEPAGEGERRDVLVVVNNTSDRERGCRVALQTRGLETGKLGRRVEVDSARFVFGERGLEKKTVIPPRSQERFAFNFPQWSEPAENLIEVMAESTTPP